MKEHTFFRDLVKKSLIKDWAMTLDWLFCEDKFDEQDGWGKERKKSFTKEIAKLKKLNGHFEEFSRKEEKFPPKYTVGIYMVKGNGKGEDAVRHIRNGIAHGHVKICKTKPYIEIEDFGSKGRMAHIYLPIEYIPQIAKIYFKVQKMKLEKSNEKKPSEKAA